MRKFWFALLASAILLMCSLPAFAGQVNEIVLSGSGKATPVTFKGTGGGNFDVNFNINGLGAFGDPSGVFAGMAGYYSILNGGQTVSFTGSSCGSGCFMLQQSGPIAFALGSSAGGNDLLTGNLTLVDIVQTPGNGGVFNDALVINLTVTGGTLQPNFIGNGGSVQLTIKFATNKNGITLDNIGKNTLAAMVVSGAVFPVPEPGTLTLLGAGLLGFAGLCRKKFYA